MQVYSVCACVCCVCACVRVCVVCVRACVHACAQCTCVHVGLIKDVPSQTSNTKSFFFFFCIISSAVKVSTSGDENDPNLLAVKANHARVNRYVYTVVQHNVVVGSKRTISLLCNCLKCSFSGLKSKPALC